MIWVRKTQDENGMYVSEDGTRWEVDWCNHIYCPCGLSEAEHGYEQFDNESAALEAWRLTPWINPALEEQFNITNEE